MGLFQVARRRNYEHRRVFEGVSVGQSSVEVDGFVSDGKLDVVFVNIPA